MQNFLVFYGESLYNSQSFWRYLSRFLKKLILLNEKNITYLKQHEKGNFNKVSSWFSYGYTKMPGACAPGNFLEIEIGSSKK